MAVFTQSWVDTFWALYSRLGPYRAMMWARWSLEDRDTALAVVTTKEFAQWLNTPVVLEMTQQRNALEAAAYEVNHHNRNYRSAA